MQRRYSNLKLNRAHAYLDRQRVFGGWQTRDAITNHIEGLDLSRLSSEQIGQILYACHKAYHAGKKDADKDVRDMGCVWAADKLIPVEVLQRMQIEKTLVTVTDTRPGPWHPLGSVNHVETRYYVDYTEEGGCNYPDHVRVERRPYN